VIALDAKWLAAHPLPEVPQQTDKNARGRVVVAGGSMTVPGAILLTAEAALRAGAGKVRLATVEAAALALGIAMPEAAVFGLPANATGELAGDAGEALRDLLDASDCMVLGPGMGKGADAAALVDRLLRDTGDKDFVIDAAAISGARDCQQAVRALGGRLVLTPHPGEMIQLMGCREEEVRDRPEAIARAACERFGAVVVLKREETWIAAPGEEVLRYGGGGSGLATAGSGDVLSGILGGLLARRAAPRTAAAWAVWLHGQAGRQCAARVGDIGFLARELLSAIPALMTGRSVMGD